MSLESLQMIILEKTEKMDIRQVDDASLVEKTLFLAGYRGEIEASNKPIPTDLDLQISIGKEEIIRRLKE
jgi:hypothetical protein